MSPMFWIVLLVVILICSSIAVMLGTLKPITPAVIAGICGAIYANILETQANFSLYITEPGINFLWGIVPYSFYNLSASLVVVGLIWVGLVGFVNLIVSWYNDEPASVWR